MSTRPDPPRGEDVWVDPRLVVGASGIEGRGLFFTEPLAAGVVVVRLGGRFVTTAELKTLIERADADPDAPYVDTLTVHEDAHLVLPPATDVHFGNHSCDPTLWHVGPYELATRRAVGAGEEATIDYATQAGVEEFEMACRCDASTCRTVVTGRDWRRQDLQARYEGHWVPGLEERIRSR